MKNLITFIYLVIFFLIFLGFAYQKEVVRFLLSLAS